MGSGLDNLFEQLENGGMNGTVLAALQAILDGATPDSQENQHLDFKEDPARAVKPSGNAKARCIEMLTDAALCFANAEGESFLVLGLRDKECGQAAFTGTDADPEEVRGRIFSRTEPNLTVDAEALQFAGERLLVIRVPQGLDLYRRREGQATIRRGTSCQPLSENEREALRFRRRNPDLTARTSSRGRNDVDPRALMEGMRLFNERHPEDPVATGEELLRTLGLVGVDGELLVAGELLFAQPVPGRRISQHVWRDAPGVEPSRNDVDLPLVFAIPEILQRIAAHSNAEVDRVLLDDGREHPIRDFPRPAVDEAVLNAFAHRDWSVWNPIMVEQTPRTLRITSPGGLPTGIVASRLLSVPSTPRNHALMNALHHLGLVEQTSRGFDRMWTAMLESGRRAPEVDVSEAQVSVHFLASGTNVAFVRAITKLRELFPEVLKSVNALIALAELAQCSVLSADRARELFQMDRLEAHATLEWLVESGLLARSEDGVLVLSPEVRRVMLEVGMEVSPQADARAWILDAIRHGSAITNRTIARATNIPSRTVTEILRGLVGQGLIMKDPDGPSRGSGVRWVARR